VVKQVELNISEPAEAGYFSFPNFEDFLDSQNNTEVLEKGMDFGLGRGDTETNQKSATMWR
jgi:hypothetical protein